MTIDPQTAQTLKANVLTQMNALTAADAAVRQAIADAEAAGLKIEHALGDAAAAAERTVAKFYTYVELT